jgi:hypothetical protein
VVGIVLALVGIFVGIQVKRSALDRNPLASETLQEKKQQNVTVIPDQVTQDNLDPCSLQNSQCTMIFSPATCKMKLNENLFEGSGSSACAAKVQIYRKLCQEGRKLKRSENEKFSCHSDEE